MVGGLHGIALFAKSDNADYLRFFLSIVWYDSYDPPVINHGKLVTLSTWLFKWEHD